MPKPCQNHPKAMNKEMNKSCQNHADTMNRSWQNTPHTHIKHKSSPNKTNPLETKFNHIATKPIESKQHISIQAKLIKPKQKHTIIYFVSRKLQKHVRTLVCDCVLFEPRCQDFVRSYLVCVCVCLCLCVRVREFAVLCVCVRVCVGARVLFRVYLDVSFPDRLRPPGPPFPPRRS